MTAAARFLWPLAGRPGHGRRQVPAPDGAVCLVCGDPTGSVATSPKDALGINFDYNQAARRDAGLVCEACAWALAGRGLATLRLWTVAAVDTPTADRSHPKADKMPLGPHVQLTNRADMAWIAQLLTDPPAGEWLVTVALSGQKHVVPYARTNHGRGRWSIRVEGHTVTADPTEFRDVLARVVALRRAGFGPDTIASLDPGTFLSSRARLAAWRAHATPITAYRGSPLLTLAALIPTKETLDVYTDRYPPR